MAKVKKTASKLKAGPNPTKTFPKKKNSSKFAEFIQKKMGIIL
jgi:hypothetical protein